MTLPHLPGYNFVECDFKTNAGGVGLFIKSNNSFNVVNSLKLKTNHCEDVWVEVKLLNNDSCVVGAIYKHPHYDTSNVLDELESYISRLNCLGKKYYFCGDMYINLLNNHKENIYCFEQTLLSLGCEQFIQNPTRITTNSSTLLDHFYSNNSSQDIKCHILLKDFSDHLPIVT